MRPNVRNLRSFLPAILLVLSGAGCRPPSDTSVSIEEFGLRSPTGVPSKLTAPIYNVSGAEVPVSQLRFAFQATLQHEEAGVSQRVLVGLQSNTSYYYVWLQAQPWAAYTLYCHGDLKNGTGANVPVDTLKFALAADFNHDGKSEIIGLQANTDWMYSWELARCNDGLAGNTGSNAPYIPLAPNWANRAGDGYLSNAQGVHIPVNELKHVVAGHWTSPTVGYVTADQIRALHANNAYEYVWSLPHPNLDPWRWFLDYDGPIHDTAGTPINVNDIRYVTENRIDPSPPGGTTSTNFGKNQHELIAVADIDDAINPTDGMVYVRENAARAVRSFPLCKNPSSACANKQLIFSLDQGWINGLVANANQPGADAALDRIVAVLQRFNSKFQVRALINPNIRSDLKPRLVKVLDRLHAAGIPFVFDTYASDAEADCRTQPRFSICYQTLSSSTPAANAGERYITMPKHPSGLSTDMNYLDYYISRYGSHFTGLRIFEILSIYWQHYNSPSSTPTGYFYTTAFEVVQYAAAHGLYVFFTDNKWHNPYERYHLPSDTWPPINQVKADLGAIASAFPNTIYMGFSNNEGVRDHSDGYYTHNYRLASWDKAFTNVSNLKGIGLSNQTWLTDGHRMLFDQTIPPEDMAIWTSDAFNKNAALVQLEPFHYFFKWDRLINADWQSEMNLTTTPWSEAGQPTNDMRIFADLLGVCLEGL